MKKWNIYWNAYQLPLRTVVFAWLFLAIGTFIQSENVNIFYTFRNSYVLLAAEFFLGIGGALMRFSPILFVLAFVSKKANNATPVLMAILGMISFEVATMLFSVGNFPLQVYGSLFHISIDSSILTSSAGTVRYPLNTGLIASLFVIFATRFTYLRSRHRHPYSLFGFVNKDTSAFMGNILLCGFMGALIAMLYPLFYALLQKTILHIARDLSDPLSMAIYGLLDRAFSMAGVPDLIRQPFWFGSHGGSYQSIAGQNILGDVAIWSYFSEANSSFAGAGRFITPYYVLNLFVLPAIYIGIFWNVRQAKEQRKNFWLLLGAILLTVISGSPLALEYLLLFTAPLLLAVYLLLVMGLFAILPLNGIYLGFGYRGENTLSALPGSFADYVINLRNPNLYQMVMAIALVGVVAAVLAFLFTRLYYRYFAFDFFRTGKKEKFTKLLIEAVGGYENIEEVSSSLFRIYLSLRDLELVSYEKIEELKATRLTELKEGISLEIGSASFMLSSYLQQKLREIKRI